MGEGAKTGAAGLADRAVGTAIADFFYVPEAGKNPLPPFPPTLATPSLALQAQQHFSPLPRSPLLLSLANPRTRGAPGLHSHFSLAGDSGRGKRPPSACCQAGHKHPGELSKEEEPTCHCYCPQQSQTPHATCL